MRTPSLRSVAVFVAAGRALNFPTAASTLGLTPSAVSRRIADLEHELGVALFRRFNRRIELATAGARYLEAVRGALDLIERESEALRPPRRQSSLRLSVLQSFASLWLLPRLAAFKQTRPDLEVDELVGSQLTAGRLVKPFHNDPVPLRQSYYLVYRKERRERPALRALRATPLGREHNRLR